jgi:putative transcriptional regulator
MYKKRVSPEPSIGGILISEPFLLDSYFKRSVILLGEHDDKGTVGFILNKPTDLMLNDALEDFPVFKVPLYFGGPVQTDTIHFLHTLGERLTSAKEIAPGIFWGGDLEMLKVMMDTKQVSEDEIRFYAGYAGWEPFKLSDEIKDHCWIMNSSSRNTRQLAFSNNPEDVWGLSLRKMGNKYAILANFPENPSLN